jgi:hypothetical protein
MQNRRLTNTQLLLIQIIKIVLLPLPETMVILSPLLVIQQDLVMFLMVGTLT